MGRLSYHPKQIFLRAAPGLTGSCSVYKAILETARPSAHLSTGPRVCPPAPPLVLPSARQPLRPCACSSAPSPFCRLTRPPVNTSASPPRAAEAGIACPLDRASFSAEAATEQALAETFPSSGTELPRRVRRVLQKGPRDVSR